MPAGYLKIGGELIDNALLSSVEVTQTLNDHWWCKVECRQTKDIRIAVEDSLGKDLQLYTYDQKGAQRIIFDGFVLEATVVYEISGSYGARFIGVTRSYKLDLTEQEAYFRKKTLSDVASALAGGDGLSADVKCKSKPAKNYVQWGESDFAFLKRMAYEHQAWIRPTGQGIEICDSFQAGAELDWRVEGGLLAFDVDGRLSQASFNGTHHSARSMQSTPFQEVRKEPAFSGASGRLVAAVKSGSQTALTSGYLHLDGRAATPDEYKEALERESVRSIGGAVCGHGTSQKEDIKAGDTVTISGPMDAKGAYGVTKVVHRWRPRGYDNEFWCTPWKNYFHGETLTHRQMPGVVVGRVVDHNDPRKMGRIQVQYDWQGDGSTGWARMVTPHAGGDRGFMFMPEVGDEVLVGFEHGDAERPYILGALWNGVDTAPRDVFWGGDIAPNDVKRIVTKSGHRIQLSDKQGKESIVISTPQKLKISLLEHADETGRSMILLHSTDGDMFFSAPAGRVHLRSSSLSQEIGQPGGAHAPHPAQTGGVSAASSRKTSSVLASPGSSPISAALPMPTADQLAGGGVLKVLKLKLSHWTDPIWNGAPERYSDGISIGGSPEYRKKVRARLDELKKRESGRAVLDKLDEQGRTGRGVVIYPHKGDPDTMADDVEDSRPVDAEVDPITGKVNIKKRGKGTSSEIDFDPDWQPRYPDGSSCLPPDGALMHEMVHAAHNGDGTNLSEFEMTDPAGGESNHEEAQTMGTAPYHDSGPYGAGLDTMLQPTENTYRRETGLPERTSHNGAKSLCPERPTPALPATEPSSTTFPREML